MSVCPIFVKLEGRPTLVVGGGALAESRVGPLLQAGARVEVVAPVTNAQLAGLALNGQIQWRPRRFARADVKHKALVFAATGRREVDRAVVLACRQAGVPGNAIDDPEYCDFYTAAVVRRGDLQIAVSTNGQSPALATRIRQQLELQFDEGWAERLEDLGRRRRQVLAAVPPGELRQELLRRLASEAFEEGAQAHAG